MSDTKPQLAHRFRGYFPVIIDVETAGFNANTDALLEIAAVTLHMDEEGMLHPDQTYHAHVTRTASQPLWNLMALIRTAHCAVPSTKMKP